MDVIIGKVDSRQALANLTAARKAAERESMKSIRAGVRAIAVPIARRRAPHHRGALSASVRAGVTTKGAYLREKTPYAGLIEFGGTRRDVVKAKKPMPVGAGRYRMAVTKPRRYGASHALRDAAKEAMPAVVQRTQSDLIMVYSRYFRVSP